MIEDIENPCTLLFDSYKAVYRLAYHLEYNNILFSIDEINKDCYELTIDRSDEERVKKLILKRHMEPPLEYKISSI